MKTLSQILTVSLKHNALITPEFSKGYKEYLNKKDNSYRMLNRLMKLSERNKSNAD